MSDQRRHPQEHRERQPGRQHRCPLLALLRAPRTWWLLVTVLYLVAAVLSIFLTMAMATWWPLALAGALAVAAATCAVAALNRNE